MIRTFLSFVYRLRKRHSARTIRRSFSIGSVALVALVATTLLNSNQTYLALDASTNRVVTQEQFYVDVYVHAAQSVNAVDMLVSYPETAVDVTGIDVGNSVISIWTEDPQADNGTVVLRGGTFRKGFLGKHLIARINLEATTSGRADFSVSDHQLLAGDGAGSEVTAATDDGVTVVAVSEDGELEAEVQFDIITDLDSNGKITLADVEVFVNAWRRKDWRYDFNNDQKMNFTDFAIILADSFFK